MLRITMAPLLFNHRHIPSQVVYASGVDNAMLLMGRLCSFIGNRLLWQGWYLLKNNCLWKWLIVLLARYCVHINKSYIYNHNFHNMHHISRMFGVSRFLFYSWGWKEKGMQSINITSNLHNVTKASIFFYILICTFQDMHLYRVYVCDWDLWFS